METNTHSTEALEFKELGSDDLLKTLGLTIKQDEINKLVTFLCELSAYTDNSQFNISYNAPSSSGKSYIPTEIAKLFPPEDILEVGYCSPTAFFHDTGSYDQEAEIYTVDLSRKILIFLDQPHMMLLQHLRPLLSHDKKEIRIKITDKKQKFGLKTKNVVLKGFPAVIFCTAGLNIDEQEATRFLLLSPEVNQEKIREGVNQIISKESNSKEFLSKVRQNKERGSLIDRIYKIKMAGISDIQIGWEVQEQIRNKFFGNNKLLKPRHQRDIKRLVSLIKLFATLNFWWRDLRGNTITCNEADMREAFKIWDTISESQELNLPPYIFNLYKDVIVPLWQKANEGAKTETARQLALGEKPTAVGISRTDISAMYHKLYGRYLADWQLRQQILPMLESSGLVMLDSDPSNRRKTLIYPTTELYIGPPKQYGEYDGRVNQKTAEISEAELSEAIPF